MTEFNGIGVDIVYDDPLTVVLHIYLTFVGISGTGIIFTPTDVENSLYDNNFFFGGNFNTAAGICAVFVISRFTAINIGKLTGIIGYCGVYRNRFLANGHISGLACSANGAGTSILFVLPRPFVPGMTESFDLFDFFVFTFDANSVFATFLGAGRLCGNFPINVDMTVSRDLFRFESCIANGTIFISTTFTRTSRRGGDSPFARNVIDLFKVFNLEFFTANGTNFMFATLILAGGFFDDHPIARSVTERANVSCLVVFAATLTIEDGITALRAGGRNGLYDLANQMAEHRDLVTSRVVAARTSFVRSPADLGASSRLGFVLLYVMTEFGKDGIRQRDLVFTSLVGEIQIVIRIVPICDMTIGGTSRGYIVVLGDALGQQGNVNLHTLHVDHFVRVQRKGAGIDIADNDLAVFDGNDAPIRIRGIGIFSVVDGENHLQNGFAVFGGHLDGGVPTRPKRGTVAALKFNYRISAVIIVSPVCPSVRIDLFGNHRDLSAFRCTADAANVIFGFRFGLAVDPSAPGVRVHIWIRNGDFYCGRIAATRTNFTCFSASGASRRLYGIFVDHIMPKCCQLFCFEFFSAHGTNLMLAAHFGTGRLEGNDPFAHGVSLGGDNDVGFADLGRTVFVRII